MPRISPTMVTQPNLNPWFSPALMAAMAPGPGEILMAQEAAKKVSQVESSMLEVY